MEGTEEVSGTPSVPGVGEGSTKRGLTLRAVQWPEYSHGIETWLLWSDGKKHRVEKIDGKWTPEELGLVVARG